MRGYLCVMLDARAGSTVVLFRYSRSLGLFEIHPLYYYYY